MIKRTIYRCSKSGKCFYCILTDERDKIASELRSRLPSDTLAVEYGNVVLHKKDFDMNNTKNTGDFIIESARRSGQVWLATGELAKQFFKNFKKGLADVIEQS